MNEIDRSSLSRGTGTRWPHWQSTSPPALDFSTVVVRPQEQRTL
jgi:hypothetical protein